MVLRNLRARGDVGVWAAQELKEHFGACVQAGDAAGIRARGRLFAIAMLGPKRARTMAEALVFGGGDDPELVAAYAAGVREGQREIEDRLRQAGARPLRPQFTDDPNKSFWW